MQNFGGGTSLVLMLWMGFGLLVGLMVLLFVSREGFYCKAIDMVGSSRMFFALQKICFLGLVGGYAFVGVFLPTAFFL